MNPPEKEIRSEEERYRGILEYASEIILIFNEKGEILYANQGAADISAYLTEELIRMNIADILPPEHYEYICNKILSPLRGARPQICLYEADFIDRELRLIPVEINVNPLPPQKNEGEYLFTARDIRLRNIPEKEKFRMHYFDVLAYFSSDLAGHLQKLFKDIISEVEFVRDNSDPQSTAYRRLSDARNACEWGRHIIHDLADALNPDVSEMEKTDAEDLIRKTALAVAGDFGLQCDFSIPGSLRPLLCNENHMARVFHHLILNAAEAAPADGRIHIRMENISSRQVEDRLKSVLPLDAYIKISVQDKGGGIPEVLAERIFVPYFSTKNRNAEDARGLGLPLVYSVVRKHQGYVEMCSVPGGKTVFNVYLPVSPVLSGGNKSSGEKEKNISSGGRILLMDDEEIIREVAGNMLRTMGYQVSFAGNGDDALSLYKAAMLSEEAFDLVILDLNVDEGSDGKTAIRELLKADPDVKAVVSSGYSNDPFMSDYKTFGFCGAVSKPYSLRELKSAVQKILGTDT